MSKKITDEEYRELFWELRCALRKETDKHHDLLANKLKLMSDYIEAKLNEINNEEYKIEKAYEINNLTGDLTKQINELFSYIDYFVQSSTDADKNYFLQKIKDEKDEIKSTNEKIKEISKEIEKI